MQLLRMTLTVRDTPVRKYAIGTSQRAAGEDVVTHTWRKNTTNRYTTVCYLVEQGMSSHRGNGTAKRPFLLIYHLLSLSRAIDAKINDEEQNCIRTKAANNGILESRMPALRFRHPGKSTSLGTSEPKRFGSISAFQIFPRMSPRETLQPTRPTELKCHAMHI